VDPEAGTGPLTLVPMQDYVLHFQLGPGTPASIQVVEQLVIRLLPLNDAGEKGYPNLDIWDHLNEVWRSPRVGWGANDLDIYPLEQMVSHKGDLIVRLSIVYNQAVELSNVLVTAVVRDHLGNSVTYGYGSK
jgi:hypothetical protein